MCGLSFVPTGIFENLAVRFLLLRRLARAAISSAYRNRIQANRRKAHSKPVGSRPCTLTSINRKIVEIEWWAVTGSNRRPTGCKPAALPAELTALSPKACDELWSRRHKDMAICETASKDCIASAKDRFPSARSDAAQAFPELSKAQMKTGWRRDRKAASPADIQTR